MFDIYNRDPSDPFYKEGQIEITDPVESCVGQLKMLLLTNKGEVLGDPKFGIGLDGLLFDLELSESSIREEINKSLITYVPLFYRLGGYFDMSFYLGTNRDIGVFDFYIPVTDDGLPVVSLKVT